MHKFILSYTHCHKDPSNYKIHKFFISERGLIMNIVTKKTMLVFSILVCICGSLCGCSSVYNTYPSTESYENEDFETVNTSKVDSTYSLSPVMRELRKSVMEMLGENYWPNALYTAEEFEELTGISEEMYHSFLAEYEHTEAGTDMMILVEAKEEDVTNVELLLDKYREKLLKTYEKQPLNHAKVEASRIEVIDNYICFVQLGADTSALKNADEDALVSFCQNQNEQALDILEKRLYAMKGF